MTFPTTNFRLLAKAMERKEAFNVKKDGYTSTSNLFGVVEAGIFTVYSYGKHWPITTFCPVRKVWLVNSSKQSVTTTHHTNKVLTALTYMGAKWECVTRSELKDYLECGTQPQSLSPI